MTVTQAATHENVMHFNFGRRAQRPALGDVRATQCRLS
jgi:hypothetical protein